MGRILCAWSPNWAINNWHRRNSSAGLDDPGSPFALIATERGMRVLAAVDQAGREAGLRLGQKATDAAALCPELKTAEADTAADAEALVALMDWCVRFSPAVAADPPGGLFLDVTGVAHLWGGEVALMADFKARLAANGLDVRVALADTPGAAWALAHYGQDGTIAPAGEQAALLDPLPPAALRLPLEVAAQIARLGLVRLDQLMALPRGPFARRFGAETLTRLDQALGRSREALTYRQPPEPWLARLALADPISQPEDLARVSADITATLCARLERAGRGARRFYLTFHRLDGQAPALSVGLAAAGRDAARITKLFLPKLDVIDPGFGIEVVTLSADEVESVSERQVRLDSLRAPGLEESLLPLIDRLSNRLGPERVWKAVPVASHVPERSVVQAAPLALNSLVWDSGRPRPVRLFRRPEPLESVMAPVPDDPPLQFRWRKRLYRVRHAEGPERISEEWWRGPIEAAATHHVRDYYRVEDEAGARFWLFRAGLYEADRPTRWWLHGLFG